MILWLLEISIGLSQGTPSSSFLVVSLALLKGQLLSPFKGEGPEVKWGGRDIRLGNAVGSCV